MSQKDTLKLVSIPAGISQQEAWDGFCCHCVSHQQWMRALICCIREMVRSALVWLEPVDITLLHNPLPDKNLYCFLCSINHHSTWALWNVPPEWGRIQDHTDCLPWPMPQRTEPVNLSHLGVGITSPIQFSYKGPAWLLSGLKSP